MALKIEGQKSVRWQLRFREPNGYAYATEITEEHALRIAKGEAGMKVLNGTRLELVCIEETSGVLIAGSHDFTIDPKTIDMGPILGPVRSANS